MQIAIIALGSRGDVQPYIALGKGLKNAGHAVRLVTQENFETLTILHGLEFWPMGGNSQEGIERKEWRELSEKGNLFTITRHLMKEAQRIIVRLVEDGLAACQGMDLLITGSMGNVIGITLAEKLHLPLLQAHLIPITPTRTFPSALLPLPNSGGVRSISYHLVLFYRRYGWECGQSST